MDTISIIAFVIILVSILIMSCELKYLLTKSGGLYNKNRAYTIDELKAHRESMQTLAFFGTAAGILFWGVIIGLIISFVTTDFNRLLNSLHISSIIASLPGVLGVLHIYKKRNLR